MFAVGKTAQEEREEQAIAHRRQREAERMTRFFDTKLRTMGMDYAALVRFTYYYLFSLLRF